MSRRFYVVIGHGGFSIGRKPLIRRETVEDYQVTIGRYREDQV
jgi:hypothetical protein